MGVCKVVPYITRLSFERERGEILGAKEVNNHMKIIQRQSYAVYKQSLDLKAAIIAFEKAYPQLVKDPIWWNVRKPSIVITKANYNERMSIFKLELELKDLLK